MFPNHRFDKIDIANTENGFHTSENFTEQTNTFQFRYPTSQSATECLGSSQDQANHYQRQNEVHHEQQCEEYNVQEHQHEDKQGRQEQQQQDGAETKGGQNSQEFLDAEETEIRLKGLLWQGFRVSQMIDSPQFIFINSTLLFNQNGKKS